VKQVCEKLKSTIDGRSDEKKPNEYHTLEFGAIYNNTIRSILEQPEEQSARFVNWTNRNIKID